MTKLDKENPELPPFFSNWNRLYIFMVAQLVVLATLFYFFSAYYK